MPRPPWIQRAASLALLLSAACSSSSASSPEGGQTGGEGPTTTCTPHNSPITPLDPSTKSAAGFSAQDLLGKLAQLKALPLKYTGGGSTTLALDTQYVGPTGYDVCHQLEVVVSLHFVTADGAFAETLPATLLAPRVDVAGSSTRVMLSAVHGNYVTEHASSFAADSIEFDVSFTNGTAHGTVLALGTEAGGSPIIATF